MDSDDDQPLVKRVTNGVKSKPRVSSVNNVKPSTNGTADPGGVSLRNGPMEEISTREKDGMLAKPRRKASTNGNYKEVTDSDDEPVSRKKRKATNQNGFDSDSDQPLAKKSKHLVKKPPKVTPAQLGEDSDSDVPLARKLANEKAAIEKKAEKTAKAIRAEDNKEKAEVSKKRKETDAKTPAVFTNKKIKKELPKDDDDSDVPLTKRKTSAKVKKEDSDDDKPLSKKVASKTKPSAATPSKNEKTKGKAAVKKEESAEDAEEDEEQAKWWAGPMTSDGTNKWTTLEHNGVIMAPEYEPLPDTARLRYDGVPVKLKPKAEEIATFFGSMLTQTQHTEREVFQKNFFDDFKKVLDETGHGVGPDGKKVVIKQLAKCDFKPIFEHFDALRKTRLNRTSAEKKAEKAEKEEKEKAYQFCVWDGKKQRIGNFRVEPPGLFRGRGDHPKTGRVKKRVMPEQVTINIGKRETVPAPPPGHRWKEVKHDRTGQWLAMWQENINGNYKYVMLAADSDIKGMSDMQKFEKARELKKHVDKIRKDYTKQMQHNDMFTRQRATAIYLIDKFALRAGNEKKDDEAETVGCCSLKCENLQLQPPNQVIFDFLGKDSIRFHEQVTVDEQVFKNLKIFKREPKTSSDDIFDRISTDKINEHLKSYMTGLSAKVFRTYNASWTMQEQLKGMNATGTIQEKIKSYNEANRRVAIICNHKRTVAASHENQMDKMNTRIKGLRYQQWRLKQMMLAIAPNQKKKKGAEYFELPDDMDQEWIKEHQAALVAEKRQAIEKKFEKDNEKLKANGDKQMNKKELEERLEVADELEKKYKVESKKGKVEPEGKSPSVEKYEQDVVKLDDRINNEVVKAQDKEGNKEVSLGTSKINYIDPRLTAVFSKRFGVPIERFFSKRLREKFQWAWETADENWEF